MRQLFDEAPFKYAMAKYSSRVNSAVSVDWQELEQPSWLRVY